MFDTFIVRQLINRIPVSEEQGKGLSALTQHIKTEVPSGLNRRLLITVKSQVAEYSSRPPDISLQLPPQYIRLRKLAENGMDPTIVLLSPVTLNLISILELFRDNMLRSILVAHLMPDGINGQLRAYNTSFPDDLWKELSDHCPQDDCKFLLYAFSD